MNAHPYDDHVPSPWAPDWELLAAIRDSYARVFARCVAYGLTPECAEHARLLHAFQTADAAIRSAQHNYLDRRSAA